MSQIRLDENAVAPGTPSAAKSIIYPKADGKWYSKDDAGTESNLSSPSGSDTQVQFNDAGVLAGDAGLTYNKTTDVLTAGGVTITGTGVSALDVAGGINAGSGNVALVGTDGRITKLSTTEIGNTTSAQLAGVVSDETGSGFLVFGDSPTFTTLMTVGAGGTLRVGHTAAITQADGEAPFIQSYGVDSRAGQSIFRASADGQGAGLYMAKSRTAALNTTRTIVVNGDELGRIVWSGDDGVDVNTPAAKIVAIVDGVPGANDMPGRLEFHTTADGAASTTERWRITSAGELVAAGNGVIRASSKLSFERADGTAAFEILGSDGSATFTSSRQTDAFTLDGTNSTDATTTRVLALDSSVAATSTSLRFVRFTAGNGATEMGTITANNSAVAYNTTSDERLKTFLGTASYGLDTINRIRVGDFYWNNDDGRRPQFGVSAQELFRIYPLAVSVGDDETQWGVDYGKLTAPIIKAIQELDAENAVLRARVEALEQPKPRKRQLRGQ